MEANNRSWVPSIRYDMSTTLSSITVRIERFATQVTYEAYVKDGRKTANSRLVYDVRASQVT